jgi:hypothetical protein
MSNTRFPSPAFTRLALIVTVPVAVLIGADSVSHALTLKSWNTGDTLTAAELNANFQAIENELAPQPWTAVTYGTGWVTYPSTDYDGGSYRKRGNMVYLRGVLSGSDFAALQTITTLPAGYRPLKRKIFTVPCLNQEACRVDVLASGVVNVYGKTGAGFLGLDGVSFPVD